MTTIITDFLFKKINVIVISSLLAFPLFSYSQTPNGPGGVQFTNGTGTLEQWYRADLGITLTGGLVSTWADQSGNGNNLTAPSGFRPATVVDANLNNQTCVAYNGGQYFTSLLSGPNVNALTIFLVARGTSYQSLFRWQNSGGTYVVYPWEYSGANRTFISSSDGGTGGGIASGLITNANNLGVAMYVKNTTNGMQTYINGALNVERNSTNATLPTQPFYSGRYNPGSSEYPTCDVGEMIVYNTNLNNTQLWIVENYLAAKYNCTLTTNVYYSMNTVANGSYYHDVAGIGQKGGNAVNDARGTGIVEINNPS
ncbi:MAG TPA: hypothetical protein VNG53_00520, partial [Bacteroidia bacterium]|nr:hypothetical protein [Bacteroidia bacterium]